jgi:hypothetical protein
MGECWRLAGFGSGFLAARTGYPHRRSAVCYRFGQRLPGSDSAVKLHSVKGSRGRKAWGVVWQVVWQLLKPSDEAA